MIRAALIALAPCLLLAAARPDDAARADRDQLQGPWTLVSLIQDGERASDETLSSWRIAFTEGGYTVRVNGQVVEQGTQTLDSSRQPKTIDFTITRGPDRGTTQLGIYQLEGDRLRICFAHPGARDRPREFGSTSDTRSILLTLRRDRR